MPANDLKGFIAWLKDNPDRTVGTAGQGSISHVCGLIFQNATGTQLQFVPYRGIAPAMQDLVAGQIDMIISDPVTAMPQVRGGNIKVYAVCASTRLPSAPDIPTVDEAGLPGYHVALWHGLWMPRGTPKPIMAKLHAAVVEALADPAVRAKLADARPGHLSARTADAGGARRPAEGRDREMVADHQGRQHQGGIESGRQAL